MFLPLQYDSGKLVRIPLAVSQTITKGMALVWASGYLAKATDAATSVPYIAMEDKVTGSGDHFECLVLPTSGIRFTADCSAVADVANRGAGSDLNSDAVRIVPATSTNKPFVIEEIVGTPGTSTKVIGYFD